MKEKTGLPQCCGQQMKLKTDLGKFVEVYCGVCSDTIYIKKQDIPKPQMIDD